MLKLVSTGIFQELGRFIAFLRTHLQNFTITILYTHTALQIQHLRHSQFATNTR